jgi:hypothetical protein
MQQKMQNPTAKALAIRLRCPDYTTESQLTKRYFTLRSREPDRRPRRSNAKPPRASSDSVAGSGISAIRQANITQVPAKE